MATLTDQLRLTPDEPGVYLIRDAAGKPLYVGKASSLRKRLQQHFRDPGHAGPWHAVMISRAASFEVTVTSSPAEALLLEATLVKQDKPRFNIRLTDDKSYPYLMLTTEPYPRLVLLRDLPANARPGGKGRAIARGLHDPQGKRVHRLEDGDIFGPFPDAKSMRRTMHLAERLFGLRSCRKQLEGRRVDKPCLNYHIRRCVGPCTGEITRAEYREIVRQVRRFLKGQGAEVVRDLRRQMEAASAALDFERAALLRDRLRALQRVTDAQVVVSNRQREQDIAAVAAAEDSSLATVALLRVRHGRLVGQEDYLLRQTADHSPAEMLEAFLTQHYSAADWAPRELLVATPVEETGEWEATLAALRGARVSVRCPQRGAGCRLVELAERNAAAALVQARHAHERRERTTGQALEDLRELLGLPAPPQRIEGYDVSNLQGDYATASLVVFAGGLPEKASYRRFRLHTAGPDDFAMLAEALRRRLQRAAEGDPKFLPLPDLLMVDGGKGQVSAARQILEETGFPELALVGLAKREEEVFVPGRSNPLDTEGHLEARYLLQRVRDEAHRFARSYHVGLREQGMTRSALDDVPGLGEVRRQSLWRAFPSLQEMARASEEELAAVPGMNRPAARALRDYLVTLNSAAGGTDDEHHSEEDPQPGADAD